MLFKFLNANFITPVAQAKWPLPSKDEAGRWVPGKWTELVRNPCMCERGWHLSTERGIAEWVAENAFVAESNPEYDSEFKARYHWHPDKLVFPSARLVRQIEKFDLYKAAMLAGLASLEFSREVNNLDSLQTRELPQLLEFFARDQNTVDIYEFVDAAELVKGLLSHRISWLVHDSLAILRWFINSGTSLTCPIEIMCLASKQRVSDYVVGLATEVSDERVEQAD